MAKYCEKILGICCLKVNPLLYCFIEMNATLNNLKYESSWKLANHDGNN